eukprot:TRINITY_DN396_c0_g2_i1.p1 TRINITY_DN396_c0_g2~~TRINITY_DN396_c0_g2_i1.p1  ORF type:complete len:216 (-),score=53.98 TRINITY_DN396_c0_g2_i1:1-648(-)
MSTFAEMDQELDELTQKISAGLDKAKKQKGEQKSKILSEMNALLRQANRVLRQIRSEIRDLDPKQRQAGDMKVKEHSDTITKLVNEHKWLQSESDKGELVGGASSSAPMNADNMTAQQLVQAGLKVQDDSLSSALRIQRTVAVTQDVANATATKLMEQTEQLQKVSDNLDQLESNLKRADRELKMFIRRMATDKVILCFLVLIVIAVVFVIGHAS